MQVYLAGTPVTLVVPLKDGNGNSLTVDSIEYRVVDQDGLEVVAQVALFTFSGESEAVIEIPAEVNNIAPVPTDLTASQIDTFNVRGARTVELFLSVASNTILLNASYVLEPASPLVVGVNTFQTLTQAELSAMSVPNLAGWSSATDRDKMAALVDARSHIAMLSFSLLNSNAGWGQDSLNYVAEGSYPTSYVGGQSLFVLNGNLTQLTPSQYDKLPPRFKAALCLAQVAEADSILGGDPTDALRRDGLLSDAVGETRQTYRAGKPLDMPVCKRALRFLSQFITLSRRIGRG